MTSSSSILALSLPRGNGLDDVQGVLDGVHGGLGGVHDDVHGVRDGVQGVPAEGEVEGRDCKVEDILVGVQLVLVVVVVVVVEAGKVGGWRPWPSSSQPPPVLPGAAAS